jgi:hypothetical protein
MVLIRELEQSCQATFAFAKHQNMNILLTANKSLFTFPADTAFTKRFKTNTMVTFATLNRVEVILHTSEGQQKYRVEEKDDIFFIFKLQRGLFGFTYFKKLAQARCRESALKIIHILTSGEVLRWEVSPVGYFEDGVF